MNEITPSMAVDAVLRHIPADISWAPATAAIGAVLIGLLLMVRGARLVPAMIALAFSAGGVLAGLRAGEACGAPVGPTMAAGGLIGLILGILFLRLWVAGLVAAFLAAAALALYGANSLRGPLSAYGGALQRAGEEQLVSLPDAVQAAPQGWPAAVGDLWAHLVQHVPTFQANFYAIVISAGIAGLLLGLLLPRAARALCAATLGTPLLVAAAYALLRGFWPQVGPWLDQWGPILAACLWGVSLIYNLADVVGIRPRKKAALPPAKPAPAR